VARFVGRGELAIVPTVQHRSVSSTVIIVVIIVIVIVVLIFLP